MAFSFEPFLAISAGHISCFSRARTLANAVPPVGRKDAYLGPHIPLRPTGGTE